MADVIFVGAPTDAPWVGRQAGGTPTFLRSGDKGLASRPIGSPWATGGDSGPVSRLTWTGAELIGPVSRVAWGRPEAYAVIDAGIVWATKNSTTPGDTRVVWAGKLSAGVETTTLWGWKTTQGFVVDLPFSDAPVCAPTWYLPWGARTYLRPPFENPWRPEVPGQPPYVFPWPIEPPAALTVPIRDLYMIVHSAYVQLRGDGTDVPAAGLNMASDADSPTWDVELDLAGKDSSGLLTNPGADEVTVNVNGYEWDFVIEEKKPRETFSGSSWRAAGRSLAARMGDPFSRPRDLVSDTTLLAQQLALAELPLAGWGLDWSEGYDWTVPAGAFAYQNLTPIKAIKKLAEAGGNVLQSTRQGQGFIVIPRYPTLPWNLAGATVEYGIPEEAILALSYRHTAFGTYNAVFVHGGEVGGVLGHVTLNATAGDLELRTIVDDLITANDAARGRGGAAIADAFPAPAIETITIPLSSADGDFPLCQIGQVVQVVRASGTVTGVCHGVAVSVAVSGSGFRSTLVARQTIRLHGRANNAWVRLGRLNPGMPRQAGQITSLAGDVATVQVIGGGFVKVRGAAGRSVNDWVFLRDDLIEGSAPSLTPIAIEV